MADGYAWASGEVGVCISTTGPGALNTVVPLGTAFFDSTPVLSIASEIPIRYVGLKPDGREYLRSCDLILAVGTGFTRLDTAEWKLELPKTVVQIEIDAAEIGRNYAVSTAVVGDARGVPAHLVSRPAA